MPKRTIGSEVLEASVKLRKSSVDCLSAASFGAARSEQLRLPAEGPLKRWDGSSCKSMFNPISDGASQPLELHFLQMNDRRSMVGLFVVIDGS